MSMRLVALLLVLSLPGLSFGESARVLSPTQKDALMTALSEVESYLLTLKVNLIEKDNLTNSLEEALRKQGESLESLRLDLLEALRNLDASEASRVRTEKLLTEASKALKESERLLKDYRFWSDVRFYLACGVAVLLAVLLALK